MHINTQTLTNVFPRSTSAHVSTAWFCSTQGSIFSSGFTASVKGTWFSWPRHGLSPPTQYIIVANEGLFIRIPDPKHVYNVILVVTRTWEGGYHTHKSSSRLASGGIAQAKSPQTYHPPCLPLGFTCSSKLLKMPFLDGQCLNICLHITSYH